MEQKVGASSCDKVVSSLLIVIAMEAEAAPLLAHLQLEPLACDAPFAPCSLRSGIYKGTRVTVVTNGKDPQFGVDNVGTVPAALATFLAINQVRPDLVINAGTAGGFKGKGAAIGDPFISTSLKNHDRRIAIPGFTEYGIDHCKSLPCPNLVRSLNLKTGVVTTGNSLDHTDMDDKMMLDNDASVKDMEGAAIAWTAALSRTPFFALKVVTDIVDSDRPTHVEFLENLHAAAKSLQESLPKIVEFVAGKKLADL
jgi:5'-methylthioadenosine nucleosidase